MDKCGLYMGLMSGEDELIRGWRAKSYRDGAASWNGLVWQVILGLEVLTGLLRPRDVGGDVG
jgi:hypothetical protein